jgi:hypothetical protein
MIRPYRVPVSTATWFTPLLALSLWGDRRRCTRALRTIVKFLSVVSSGAVPAASWFTKVRERVPWYFVSPSMSRTETPLHSRT